MSIKPRHFLDIADFGQFSARHVTSLPGRARLELTYRLRATMPLRAADGGSRVSLYYQPDQKASAASTMLVVTGG